MYRSVQVIVQEIIVQEVIVQHIYSINNAFTNWKIS